MDSVIWVDVLAQAILGVGSIIVAIYMLRHCDDFSDGNVGSDE